MSNTQIVVPPTAAPSVNILACGGAGINLLRKALPHVSDKVTYRFIDTSYSNVRPGEQVIIAASEGKGSGLHRRENSESIVQRIAKLTDDDLQLADINIILFSMSGGSGSTAGPLLIKDIHRRGKLIIAMAIASSESQKHTENTLATLKSLENITSTIGLYLPISIFCNEADWTILDKIFVYKLERLVDLLTLRTIELDKTDRMHWVNVQKTIGAAPGLRLLYVDGTGSGNKQDNKVELIVNTPDYIFDSVLAIRTETVFPEFSPQARTRFVGIFETVTLTPMVGVIGNPPDAFDTLIKDIDYILLQYKSQVFRSQPAIAIAPNDIDQDSGLIF